MNVVTKVFMGMSFVGAMKLKSGRNSFGKRVVLNMHTLGKSHLNKLTKSLTTFLFQKVSEFPSVRRLGEWGGIPSPPTTRELAGHPHAHSPHYCGPKMLILQFSFS